MWGFGTTLGTTLGILLGILNGILLGILGFLFRGVSSGDASRRDGSVNLRDAGAEQRGERLDDGDAVGSGGGGSRATTLRDGVGGGEGEGEGELGEGVDGGGDDAGGVLERFERPVSIGERRSEIDGEGAGEDAQGGGVQGFHAGYDGANGMRERSDGVVVVLVGGGG